MRKPLSLIATALATALTLLSSAAWAAGPVRIVAAENFYGDLASQIGGDHVAVTSILSNPEQDPHLFESSPSAAKALTEADVIIYNGADYDPWMEKLLSASPHGKSTVIVAAALIGKKSGDNPHLWYNLATMPALAKTLAADLEKRDPDHAADYKKNLAAFDASFETIKTEVAAIKAKHSGLKVTATEPVFGYMAEALGFVMLNEPFQIAVMNDAEPSPSQVAAFEKTLKDHEAKILFYNNSVTDKTTTHMLSLAKEAKVAVVGVGELEPRGKTIQTWFGGELAEIRRILESKTQ